MLDTKARTKPIQPLFFIFFYQDKSSFNKSIKKNKSGNEDAVFILTSF